MDLGNSQAQGPIYGNDTSAGTASPPSLIWIIAPLIIVLLTGALLAILYKVIMRCKRRKAAGGDAELGAARGPQAETLEVGDATLGGDRPHTAATGTDSAQQQQQQPADRWGWVFGPVASASNININSGSGMGHVVTQPVEGLNELGEAPPPYGETGERTKSYYMAEMVGAQEVGAGPSCGAVGPEPPAYEVTIGPGEASSIQEPPPAVTSQPR